MRKVKRWRYYCDYCKKVSGNAGHMKSHEKHCTANPNRICGMCNVLQVTQKSIEELKKELRRIVKKFSSLPFSESILMDMATNEKAVDEFREFTNGCPACMLAAIRQIEEEPILSLDFKKECKDFWSDINERDYQEECY